MFPRIWQFAPWFPYEIGLDTLGRHCSFLNSAEVFEAGLPTLTARDDQYPVPKLKLSMKQFDVDCFTWESLTLVSARMREAMALPTSTVRFFDVDDSPSAEAVQAKEFQVLGIAAREAAVDSDRSEFRWVTITPDSPPMPAGATRMAIKPGFTPQHELFYDAFLLGHSFCTDALAVRLLRASCSGIRFLDPDYPTGNRMRFRTLRGVEQESDWDERSKTMSTTVVEAIHWND